MHILIVAAGTWHRAPEKALFATYLERLAWKLELVEIVVKSKHDTEKDRQAEGEKLLAAADRFRPHHQIALDERGKNYSSREFAKQIGRWQDAGENRLVFFIGGHHGLDEILRKQADVQLSFGQMTWPHLLARPMLAEQLYRAQTILAGHPYHRD